MKPLKYKVGDKVVFIDNKRWRPQRLEGVVIFAKRMRGPNYYKMPYPYIIATKRYDILAIGKDLKPIK